MLIAIQATDHGWDFFSERDLLEEFGRPDRDFARGSMGIFTGGAMVGYGTLGCRDAADPVHEMRYWGGVHPAYRQRGLGGQLLGWAETAAVPLHRERYPDRPLSLSGFCLSHNAAAVALYAARGYQPVRWFHAMVRDLTTALPEVPAPPGVQITAFTPEQSETARLIRNEAFTDHRGSTETSAEGWAHFMAASAFRPAFSFLAYASGEPAGFVISHEYDVYAEATGIQDLFIAMLGRAGPRGSEESAPLCWSGRSPRPGPPDSPRRRWRWTPIPRPAPSGCIERAGFTVDHTSVTQSKPLLP